MGCHGVSRSPRIAWYTSNLLIFLIRFSDAWHGQPSGRYRKSGVKLPWPVEAPLVTTASDGVWRRLWYRLFALIELSAGLGDTTGSSRAQARTTVGREFPISALSMAERGPSPAIVHVSCALSKMPYGGFSPVRLPAEVSR